MAKRTFQLVLLIIVAFGSASYVVFSTILTDIEQNDQAYQQQLLSDISNQIELSYELLNGLLMRKGEGYRQLHQLALTQLTEPPPANGKWDLQAVKQRLEALAGYTVDLFVIDTGLKVIDTTFAPDLGLDFNLPPFVDAQYFLRAASDSDSIMVGQPSMEFSGKRFKIYTYSKLDATHYLELGLIDPEVNGYFQKFIGYQIARKDARVRLFFELWDEMLVPLTLAAEEGYNEKSELFPVNEQQTRRDHQAFRQASRQQEPLRVSTVDAQGRKVTTYYIGLTGLSSAIIGDLKMRFMAKVTFDDQIISRIKNQFQLFFLLSTLLAIAGLLYLAYFIRGWFIRPLDLILGDIEAKRPVDLTALPGESHEFKKIAITYNDALGHLLRNMQELQQQSTIDPLTRLHNRRYFTSAFGLEVSRALRSHSSLALAMIDIDHFKQYNDHYGHQQGDRLLSMLAEQLKCRFQRPSDHLCRMGGDEFSILLVDIDAGSAASIFEGLQQAWRQLVSSVGVAGDGHPVAASISIGVFIFDGDCRLTWEDAYRRADAALYRVKQRGRDSVEVEIDGPCCKEQQDKQALA